MIHGYTKGWQGGSLEEPPVPGAEAALRSLAARWDMVVFTARHDINNVHGYLRQYGIDNLFKDVTNIKPSADVYLDDRALRFHSWPQALADLNTW